MKVRAVDFVVYNVSNMERAIAFYRDTLGLSLEYQIEGNWAEFSVGAVTLGLCGPEWATPPQRGYQGGATVALAVEDINAAIEELRGKGVTAEDAMETSVCYLALIEDPDGNRLILHQRKDGTCG
jgi:predicted enzyme related to lactoylglutathione lyase